MNFEVLDRFNPPCIELQEDVFTNKQVRVYLLRDDLRDNFLTGNKWRKLKYNLRLITENKIQKVVTFGGAYSNHIVALSRAAGLFNFTLYAIIRGDELNEYSNPILKYCTQQGTRMKFVSRKSYENRYSPAVKEWVGSILNVDSDCIFIIPEGGTNELAVRGCGEIVQDIPFEFSHIMCACGTGGTIAGISNSLIPGQIAIGIGVLRNEMQLKETVLKYSRMPENTRFVMNYNGGGYAKSNDELIRFCSHFSRLYSIPAEPVYSGKMFYGLYHLVNADYFKAGSRIVVYHSGGIYSFTDGV